MKNPKKGVTLNSRMKECCFLQDYSKEICLSDKIIVSLHPNVSYKLKIEGYEYSLLEDFQGEWDLKSIGNEFFDGHLTWFKDFDVLIKKNVSYCRDKDIPIASANYLKLKYMMDTIIIGGIVLDKFFKYNKDVRKVLFVHSDSDDGYESSIFNFSKKTNEIFRVLTRLYCEENNIEFEEINVERPKKIGRMPDRKHCRGSIMLKELAKIVKNIFTYDKMIRFIRRDVSLSGHNFLFMHAGSDDINTPIREIMCAGANIFVMERTDIFKETPFLRSKVRDGSADDLVVSVIQEECDKLVSSKSEYEGIIKYLSLRSGINVEVIAEPFIRGFIQKEIPEILSMSERMRKFYIRNKIDFVFARGNTDIISSGTLIAAKYMKGAKSVCVQHANYATGEKVYGIFETETYDYLITRDVVAQKYCERSLEQIYKTDCKPLNIPYYLTNLAKSNGKKRNVGSKQTQRQTVVYVEKKFSPGVRCFDNVSYPLCWYFEFQKKIIDLFASTQDVDFIYKHAPGQVWAEGSIIRYIEDKKTGNISISDVNFMDALQDSAKVIVDCPFGAFFEAAVMGNSVLCVCPEYLKIIKESKNIFGRSLFQYSSEEDALEKISEFISSDGDRYTVDFPLGKVNFLGVFKKMALS